jgi:hypothetical protein
VAPVIVASGLAVGWVATTGALDVVANNGKQDTTLEVFGFMIEHARQYAVQMFGSFNPRGTLVPVAVEPFFWTALGLLVLWAALRAEWRVRIAMLLIVAATLLVGLVLVAASVHTNGIVWSGRYALPLAVGLPVLAGVTVDGTAEAWRPALAAALVAVALGCQVAGIYSLLRRFSVGTRGAIDILFTHVDWEPPPGVTAVAMAALGLSVLTGAWVLFAPRPGCN